MGQDSGDDAISPLLGFIAAIAIYAIALAVFVSFTSTPPTESSTVDADLQNRAGTTLDLLVTDSGAGWVSDPDAMVRFGLSEDGQPNLIDYSKVEKLRKGKIQADATNGYPDYPEVKDALGLDDHQFHIRTYPVLIGVDDANWERMRGFRVAYLGDAQEPSSSAVIDDTWTSDGNVRIYKVTVRNEDANPMIFTGNFDLAVANNKHVSTTRQTPLLPGTATEPDDADRQFTWEIKIHPMKRWDDEPLEIIAATTDNYGYCGDAEGCGDETESITPYENNGISYEIHYLAETDQSYYQTGQTVTVKVDHFDRTGDKKTGQDARLRIYPPSAVGSWTQSGTAAVDVLCSAVCPSINPGPARQLPKNNNQEWEYACAACSTTEGLWKIVVTPPADDARDTTLYYWVDDSDLFPGFALDAVAAREVTYVNDLVDGTPDAGDFDTDIYDATTAADGDVFIDTNQEVRDLAQFIDDTPGTCDSAARRYDMLIVGSNTAHNALVKVKDEVGRFVDCGGTLIALGSSRSGTEWLSSVYNIALRDGAGGGISSPDPTHPLLNVPEKLAWNSYSDTNYVWDISQAVPGLFSHAVDGATADELMLGVTEMGALNGSVVLTGWTPGELTSPQDDAEAKRLLHNLMSQGYQMLFLDYGPEIPEGVPVGSSSRLAAVPYEAMVPPIYVEVKLVLYAWRG